MTYRVGRLMSMTFCVESCIGRRKVSCQQGIETLFYILYPIFRYLFVGVASWLLNLAMEQRYAVLVLFVLLLIDDRVSKASRHRVNEDKYVSTYKACGDKPQCCLWWDPEVSSGVMRVHIGYRGPARQGSVISSPWDPILRSERRPFL